MSKKGQIFERKLCKELSIWWSKGIRDDIFWRTAGSGARATQRAKKGQETFLNYGDVTATHPIAKILIDKFVISLKRGYTGKKNTKNLNCLSLLDLIDKPEKLKTKPVLVQWWEELQQDIKISKANKQGLIVCRRDRRQSIIIMSRETFKHIEAKKPCIYPLYNSGCWLQAHGLNLQIMKLDNFFFWCQPELLGAKYFIRKLGNKISKDWIEPGPFPNMAKEYYDALNKAICIV